jgi:hypothetical protein
MSGAIPTLPQYIFMVWCLVKHRQKFTFTSFNFYWMIPLRQRPYLNKFLSRNIKIIVLRIIMILITLFVENNLENFKRNMLQLISTIG